MIAVALAAFVHCKAKPTERERIEALLIAVERSDVVFLRNGTEYSAAEAAEHLRAKWKRAGDRIATAEQFIDELATKSSASGRPYRVRPRDGAQRDAGPWLHELLRRQ